MHISFAHHLSLSYVGGGENWIIDVSKELVKRGHEVDIYTLPFMLEKQNKRKVEGVAYKEAYHHTKIKADVCYVTYNPLSWLFFETSKPRIAGMHSHAYWQKPHYAYGLLPNIANIVNRFTSYFELRRFTAVHTVTPVSICPINHPNVYFIPNFVDSEKFVPCQKDEDFTVNYISRKNWQKGWDIFRLIEENIRDFSKVNISGNVAADEMPAFIGSGHVTVVPSRVDTFGLSIVESMMCETPTVTTPLETHKQLGLPLRYAYTPNEFVKQILMLKDMWEDRTYLRFAEFCREKALAYDKDLIVGKLEQMFREVAGDV